MILPDSRIFASTILVAEENFFPFCAAQRDRATRQRAAAAISL
jgi:hypothetical protein